MTMTPRTLSLIILGVLLKSINCNECRLTDKEKCVCFPLNLNQYEFQCPPGDNRKIVINASLREYIQIDCEDLIDYDSNLFPNFTTGAVDLFRLRFCPLPRDNFQSTWKQFNITKLENLELYNVTMPGGVITKNMFVDMSYLKKLQICLTSARLERDFLEYLPNLVRLELYNNNIRDIDFFKYVPNLVQLDLSRNNIFQIPDSVFENLTQLNQLHLWKNKIMNISKSAFKGLHQLVSLELSWNNIEFIDENAFDDLPNLVKLSLRYNKLNSLNPTVFRNNINLEDIKMGNNPLVTLPDYLFSNLSKLISINVDNSRLKSIGDNIFRNSKNLSILSFRDNELESLPDNIFVGLKNLEDLNLENNLLSEINKLLFRDLKNLKKLNLRSNQIKTISLGAFSNQKSLISLDLSYNHYSPSVDPFSTCVRLEHLNLAHNKLTIFPDQILINKVNLKSLNVSHNNIFGGLDIETKISNYEVIVDLTYNNITDLDFRNIKTVAQTLSPEEYDAYNNVDARMITLLSNNNLWCNCSNFDLVRFINDELNPVIKTMIDINVDGEFCSEPIEFRHLLIKDLNSQQITCPYPTDCPSDCSCFYRPYDDTIIVDCSYKNLTTCPQIKISFERLEVNLMGNHIRQGPQPNMGYEGAKYLFLSNNLLNSINWIPPKLRVLQLDGNRLTGLSTEVLTALRKQQNLTLTLFNNPWSCGCSAQHLQEFILKSYTTKVNANDVLCADNSQPLLNRKDLCKSLDIIILQITVPLLSFLLLTAIFAVLYFKFHQEIKVWLFSKNLCLWWVTEHELDKDKVYDVFISYSHKDEDFILQNLLPILESGPNGYDVCIHVRDWIPGEFINTQVRHSVLNSRRTLVVLSDNFLESVWGKMEFRIAHTQAIQEGRARVIILKYGEISDDRLDDDLRAYLKTNTYVEWGKPWFWNKLKFALPHKLNNNSFNENQKHANMMLKIDDKFELKSASIHPTSTPPVISLDPSLLKTHPLSLGLNEKNVTSPTEEPLIINR